ncbi:MAG TPA: PDZ domain-containing protein [Bryobacteraceae bacterium]|nr:PDZ domain-containing protein [Bryobacteraceae bacterium]
MKMFGRKTALAWLAVAAAIGMPAVAQTSAPQRARSMTLREAASRGYLGVGVVDLTDDRVKALKLKDDQGVEVKRVDGNSPAAKAGLKENDVILEVNGKSVEDITQFGMMIGEAGPGTKVNMTVWRNGAKQTVSAMLDPRPNLFFFRAPDIPDAPVPPMPPVPLNGGTPFPIIPADSAMVGFEGESLNAQLAAYFGVKEGVLVRSVNADTPAEHAGLKAGDVVVKVNGTPVTTPREITALVRARRNKAIAFTVVRNKKEVKLNVEIAEERSGAADRVAL